MEATLAIKLIDLIYFFFVEHLHVFQTAVSKSVDDCTELFLTRLITFPDVDSKILFIDTDESALSIDSLSNIIY